MRTQLVLVLALLLACGGSSSKSSAHDASLGGHDAAHADADADAPAGDGDASAPDPLADGGSPDAGNAPPDPAGERLFGVFDTFPRFDLTLSAAAEQALRDMPDAYVDAELTFTDAVGSVGPLTVSVRPKGSDYGSGRTYDKKMAFKIDFARSVAKQKLLGLRKLTLNNMVQDPSCVREWLSYRVLRAQGLPAPRAGYVRVFVNGSEFGVYLALETADEKSFLKRSFASTGVLYEGFQTQDLTPEGALLLDEDEGADPTRAALLAVANAIAGAPTQGFDEALAPLSHLDELLAMMANEVFLGDTDGYVSAVNNFYLHFDAQAQLSLVLWGMDRSLSGHVPFSSGRGLLLQRCLLDDSCKRAYRAALAQASTAVTAFMAEQKAGLVAFAGRLASELATDPRLEYPAAEVPTQVQTIISLLESQRSDLDALLACLADPAQDTDGDHHQCDDDCDEADKKRYVGAPEVCGDHVDQDCNGVLDDGACPSCAPDDTLGTSYWFCRGPRSFADAASECDTHAARLLKLESASELEDVAARAYDYLGYQTFWIGLDDRTEEGTFRWSDGTSMGKASAPDAAYECSAAQTGDHFCSWNDGEPNDFAANEDCAVVDAGSHKWNDWDCVRAAPFVCQAK